MVVYYTDSEDYWNGDLRKGREWDDYIFSGRQSVKEDTESKKSQWVEGDRNLRRGFRDSAVCVLCDLGKRGVPPRSPGGPEARGVRKKERRSLETSFADGADCLRPALRHRHVWAPDTA